MKPRELVIFRDVNRSRWDERLGAAAREMGLGYRIVEEPQEVSPQTECVAFTHLAHAPRKRAATKQRILEAQQRGAFIIPSERETIAYDDKVQQFDYFAEYMPTTFHITSPETAGIVLSQMEYPFVSKARQGAASSNVRLIRNETQARQEVNAVFDGPGLRCRHRQKQKGYLLWQEFLPDNGHDWRVIILFGRYGLVWKRYNRPHLPFASGSDRLEPGNDLEEIRPYLDYGRAFVAKEQLIFCGMDLVWDHSQDHLKLLETTTGWPMRKANHCQWFEWNGTTWLDNHVPGGGMFGLIAHWVKDRWKTESCGMSAALGP